MALFDLQTLLRENAYPGRGIVTGLSQDGQSALIAYFIMGRSVNSRNRVFEAFPGGMRTKAFDESKMADPSLIIYNPYLSFDNGRVDIVTNGDQTNTVLDALQAGKSFTDALMTREFEPDAPNFTPRISAILHYDFAKKCLSYEMSILKSADAAGSGCNRFFYRYHPVQGLGHFIHTYKCDGNPIPSFEGEPEPVGLPNTAQELCDLVWNSLNPDNKVSLLVRQIPLDGSAPTQLIVNKNQ